MTTDRRDPAIMPGAALPGAIGQGRTGGDRDRLAATALQLVPDAQAIAETVAAMVPPGTHWGVFLLPAAGADPLGRVDGARRVMAVTSDRRMMINAVLSWAHEVVSPGANSEKLTVRGAGSPNSPMAVGRPRRK